MMHHIPENGVTPEMLSAGLAAYPRNYQRCLMGLVSEKCGGNPVDRD